MATARRMPENVFVLCTGRCGSTTFYKACKHIRNFSSGHESRTWRIGQSRLDYPSYHIEVDNRLTWFTGKLGSTFGDKAYYLHLTRNKELVADSYARRSGYKDGIFNTYKRSILLNLPLQPKQPSDIDVARDMVGTMTANIEYFLKSKTNVMTIDLDVIEEGFSDFCDWIGADVDKRAATKEFAIRHNSG